jgi:isoleucyl-tRNA synthetase
MAVYPRTGDTDVPAQPDFPALEREVLDYWEAGDTFRESIRQRPADDEFVFYDGPPFANGLPHYGHLITGYVKDLVPRFRTMQGKRVERRFGWDCHGLPAEVEAERLLGISGKADILAMGIEKFNQACRESVLRYTREWQDYVTRQARWVDFEHDYKTLDLPYMESVMWAFKQLWDKGLVYEGYRVVPITVKENLVADQLIQPGDRVDILCFMARSAEIPMTVTKTVLTDVRIWAVNEKTERAKEKDNETTQARTVSVLVKPEQVGLSTERLGRIREADEVAIAAVVAGVDRQQLVDRGE